MVFTERDDLMMSRRLGMHRDTFSAVTDFDIASMIADPDLFARIEPRYRVAAAAPGDVCVACYFPLLVIHIWIPQTSIHRLHSELIFIPADHHLLVCCPMDTWCVVPWTR